ncbi:putative uncharacterized protein BRD3OS isoform X1 [Coturnix japonica]|uniref:putative uncharacterized protein BRD3OS isoform X1 n=1 Tax=Coturnix japonica TaxID=93934 RepID=UPI0013A5E9C6|nr:putative uncharacterized protein BRD3OS isoform X1 [Coturnix japonica]
MRSGGVSAAAAPRSRTEPRNGGLKRRSEEEGDRWAVRDLERRLGLQRWMRDLHSAVRPSVRPHVARGGLHVIHGSSTPHLASPALRAARSATGHAGTAGRTAPRCHRWVEAMSLG